MKGAIELVLGGAATDNMLTQKASGGIAPINYYFNLQLRKRLLSKLKVMVYYKLYILIKNFSSLFVLFFLDVAAHWWFDEESVAVLYRC